MSVDYDKVKEILNKKLTPPPTVDGEPPMASNLLLDNYVALQRQYEKESEARQAAEEKRKELEHDLADMKECLNQCVCGKRQIQEELGSAHGLPIPPSQLAKRPSYSALRAHWKYQVSRYL